MENGSLRVCLVHTMGVLVANFSFYCFDFKCHITEYGYGGISRARFKDLLKCRC